MDDAFWRFVLDFVNCLEQLVRVSSGGVVGVDGFVIKPINVRMLERQQFWIRSSDCSGMDAMVFFKVQWQAGCSVELDIFLHRVVKVPTPFRSDKGDICSRFTVQPTEVSFTSVADAWLRIAGTFAVLQFVRHILPYGYATRYLVMLWLGLSPMNPDILRALYKLCRRELLVCLFKPSSLALWIKTWSRKTCVEWNIHIENVTVVFADQARRISSHLRARSDPKGDNEVINAATKNALTFGRQI